MPTIEIQVKNKIALSPAAQIVCGNSDYQIMFAFDDEWTAHDVKTARFVFAGKYVDVVFSGNICNAPVISGATVCAVGVYAGDLCTTTPALVGCAKSILCGDGLPADPTPDVYAQLLAMFDELSKKQGMDGATFFPAVSDDGVLSWTNDKGLDNPEPVNIKGADGHTPVKGEDYFTDADKEEMVADVLAKLRVYDGAMVSMTNIYNGESEV